MTPNLHSRLTAAITAALAVLAGGAALAQHRLPAPTAGARSLVAERPPLYGQLANGVWVMVHRNQMFYVGQRGVRSLCPDGNYNLKNGGRLVVQAAHIVMPWEMVAFNPQPEPPGIELHAMTREGQRLSLSQGLLFFEDVGGGPRKRCADGVIRLRSGASLQIVGGAPRDLAHLQGFAP